MSLYTRLGRVEVSSSDSELDSVASSIADSADELIEELARMALAGHYSGHPSSYETNQLLRGRGMARRPRDGLNASPASDPATAVPRSTARRSSPPELRGVPLLLRSARATSPRERAVDEVESEARALEKMYRHLAREYLRGRKKDQESATSPRGGSVASAPSGEKSAAPKPRRKPDALARSRLLAPDRAQLARQTEKHERRKEREEEARKKPKRVRVSPEAVKLGTRLYLEAQARANGVKELQEEQARERRTAEMKGCTFHPSVSAYAARFAADGAYVPFLDRLDEQAVLDEERQRLRIAQAVQLERECTFHPTLSAGTDELVADQRRRHRERRHREHHSSQRRSRTRSAGHGGPAASHREPFEPGERLYRDGGERLLRQQVRLQRASTRAQRGVVGGMLRLSAEEAREVADRFTAWAAAREARTAERRRALEQQACETPRTAARREEAAVRGRFEPAVGSAVGGAARGEAGARRSAGVVDVAALATAPTAAPPLPERRAVAPPHSASGVLVSSSAAVRLHADPGARPADSHRASSSSQSPSDGGDRAPTTIIHLSSLATPRTPAAAHVSPSKADTALHKEHLRIRLGALFYKFAVSPTTSTVTLAQVKEQVRCYYPEDAGIAVALAAAVAGEQQPISKHEFMAALARYVAQCGVQPWCLPHREAAAGPLRRAGELGSESAAALHTNGLVRSSSDDSGPVHVEEAVGSESRTAASASPSPWVAAARSRRTHIYSGAPPASCGGAAPAVPALAAAASQADLARPTASVAAAAPAAPTAELVRGFSDYVQRQRRAGARARSAAASTQQREAEVCTFRPALSRRSIALSERNLEKRLGYARELEVRRNELHLLRTAMLEERGSSGGNGIVEASATAPPSCSDALRDSEPSRPSAQTPPPTPAVQPRQRASAPEPDASPESGKSPSIELSSLSASSPPRSSPNATLQSARTAGSPSPSRTREGPVAGRDGDSAADATTRRAIADLEQLLRRAVLVEPTATAKPGARPPLGVPFPLPRFPSAPSSAAAASAVGDETTRTADTTGTPERVTASEVHGVLGSGLTHKRPPSPLDRPSRFLATCPAQAILADDDKFLASRHSAPAVERGEA